MHCVSTFSSSFHDYIVLAMLEVLTAHNTPISGLTLGTCSSGRMSIYLQFQSFPKIQSYQFHAILINLPPANNQNMPSQCKWDDLTFDPSVGSIRKRIILKLIAGITRMIPRLSNERFSKAQRLILIKSNVPIIH